MYEERKRLELEAVRAELAETPGPEAPPAGQVDEERRQAEERIAGEFGLDSDKKSGLDDKS